MHSLLQNFLSLTKHGILTNSVAPTTGDFAVYRNNGIAVGIQYYGTEVTIDWAAPIIIGTGVTPKSFNMIDIPNLVDPTKFIIHARSITQSIVNSCHTISIKRWFFNNTSNDLNITQIGLTRNSINDNYYLLAYDVLNHTFPTASYRLFNFNFQFNIENININFGRILAARFDVNSNYTFITTDNNIYSSSIAPYSIVAPANNDIYGIVLGTSSVENSTSSYSLGGKLSTESLQYFQTTLSQQITENKGCSIYRDFKNITGDIITINQVGLYATNGTSSFMYYRQVLSSPFQLFPNDTSTVQIQIGVQY